MRLVFACLALTSAVGCSAGPDGTGGAAHGKPNDGAQAATAEPGADAGAETPASSAEPVGAGPFTPASHPPIAQLQSRGGPVLKNPRFVLVTWDVDPLRPQLEDFIAKLGRSSYWSTVVSEYGVGPATASAAHVPGAAPRIANDQTIPKFLYEALGSGAPLGAPDPNAVYVLVFPEGTDVQQGQGQYLGRGCVDFGGYHDELAIGSTKIAYAVIPRCAAFPPPPAPSLGGLDFVTTALSHELGEASTDPHPQTEPGYQGTDDASFVWSIVTGGENGDMCAGIDDYHVKPADLGYTVQRQWSNRAGQSSGDPCVPAPATPYFNAAIASSDALSLPSMDGSGSIATQGIKLAVGASKTVEVDLYSDQPTPEFTVTAIDMTDPNVLDLALDKGSGKNGDKLHLTVRLKAAPPGGIAPFLLQSSVGSVNNFWFGLVAN